MRRIALILASAAVLTVPAAAGAGGGGRAANGYLVVRNAANDDGITGSPVATIAVAGFVLGRISHEGSVAIYHLASAAGQTASQATGTDVSRRGVHWRSFSGTEYSGSNFRFRAVGGDYRVVVRGSGVYLFAGGHGSVRLLGSTVYPSRDGQYAVDGAAFRSLPAHQSTLLIGAG